MDRFYSSSRPIAAAAEHLRPAPGARLPSPPVSASAQSRINAHMRRSPSGDNCQPWIWRWNENSLEIFLNHHRAAHTLDRSHHASILSLGCLIETISIAAGYESLEMVVQASSPGAATHLPWVELVFHPEPSGANIDPLHGALELRETDRRVFRQASKDHPAFLKLDQQLDQYVSRRRHGVSASLLHQTEPALLEYLLNCEEFVWDHADATRDSLKWCRLSADEIESHEDSLPWPNLGIKRLDAWMLSVMRQRPALRPMLLKCGLRTAVRSIAKQQLQSSSLLLFSASALTNDALVEVGRLAFRCWLSLNQNGFGVQPMTLASLSVFDRVTGAASSVNTQPKYLQLFKNGLPLLKKSFQIPNGNTPIWMFRIGQSTRLPAEMKTKRRTSLTN